MRLIDADALIKTKQEEYSYYDITDSEFEDLVNSQPTAFDTEKVIEQLENEKERYEKDRAWWSEHSWKDSCVYNECDMNDRKSDCFEEAIDIVKKGGVE